ncbi:hypothetical protein [Actinomadura nitritigenes]|uniref:hypothetical protein n=1 Tax=Actinomadura nitritigenes TaxID=134602 RepID=UPI003D91D3DF
MASDPTLPPDLPPAAVFALKKIAAAYNPVYEQAVRLVKEYWGNTAAIDRAINGTWVPEAQKAGDANTQLDNSLGKLTAADASTYWEGNARQAYVDWRTDFKSGTLDKHTENLWQIKTMLDEVIGTINTCRDHLVAMIIELAITIAGAASSNPIGVGAAVVAGLSLLGTLANYLFNVSNDLDAHGRAMETFREQQKIDRGGGVVSKPFRTDIIGDWDNWQHKNPLTGH